MDLVSASSNYYYTWTFFFLARLIISVLLEIDALFYRFDKCKFKLKNPSISLHHLTCEKKCLKIG